MIIKNIGYRKLPFFILFSMFFLASCAPKPTIEVPEEYKKGQQYFHRVCSNCHGSDALGKYTKAPNLIDEDFLPDNFSDDDFRATVIDGTDKMPSQSRKVSSEELTEIIKYLRHSQNAADLYVESDDEEEEEEEEEANEEG